jgi:hypothetical protein
MPGILGKIKVNATVRRTKENYTTICLAKLKELPATFSGWMDKPNDQLAGYTPNEAIAADDGHLAEELIEKLVHFHEAFSALAKIFERYRDVPELEETWRAFMSAWPKYESNMEVNEHA